MDAQPRPWTPADVLLLGEPDAEGRQIALLRGRLVVRVRPVRCRPALLLEAPSGLEAAQDMLATEWTDGGHLVDLASDCLPLAERVAHALDHALGLGAWHLRQALLGWADTLLDVLPQPNRLRLDRDQGGLFLQIGKGFWIARLKDRAKIPEAARTQALRDRARRLLEETHDGCLIRRQTLAWPAPRTAHEAMARRVAFARLQDPAP